MIELPHFRNYLFVIISFLQEKKQSSQQNSLQQIMWRIGKGLHLRSYFSTQPNYFKLFGLPPNFTEQQLKSSYLQLVKKYHPDLSADPSSQQIFKQVQIGYQILSDQAKRQKHQAQQKTQKEAPSQNQSVVDQIRDRLYTNFKRKDQVNDEFNFNFNLFKKHYQKVQAPKAQYQRYEGQGNNEYYAKKDQKSQPVWKPMIAGVSALVVVGGAYFYTIK